MAKTFNGWSGKLVDTWHYRYEGVDKTDIDESKEDDEVSPREKTVISKKVSVEVRLLKDYKGDVPPLSETHVKFLVVCKEADIQFVGHDIEALRVMVWSKLDKKYEIRWDRWYLVRVDDMSPFSGIGSGLTFSYEHIDKGIAWEGTELMRSHAGYQQVIEPWPGVFKDKRGNIMACIPATNENQEAFADFSKRVTALRKRLADFFRPDNIMNTLASLSSDRAALPAPPKEDEDEN